MKSFLKEIIAYMNARKKWWLARWESYTSAW